MDLNQNPLSDVPQSGHDDIQFLRERVRQLENELADRKAQAHTQSDYPARSEAQQEQNAFVDHMVARMSAQERMALHDWAKRLLDIRASRDTMLNKASHTLNATLSNKAALPSIKLLAREAKRRAWDEQGTGRRMAVGAGLIVALMTGPGALILATAGMAAGFPLWVLFGSGNSLLETVVAVCTNANRQSQTFETTMDTEGKQQS